MRQFPERPTLTSARLSIWPGNIHEQFFLTKKKNKTKQKPQTEGTNKQTNPLTAIPGCTYLLTTEIQASVLWIFHLVHLRCWELAFTQPWLQSDCNKVKVRIFYDYKQEQLHHFIPIPRKLQTTLKGRRREQPLRKHTVPLPGTIFPA